MKPFQQFIGALVMSFALIANAQATNIVLSPGDTWNEFTLDDFSAVSGGTEWIDTNDSSSPNFGSPLHFLLTIPQGFTGFLTLVDGGFAGDRFEIFNQGISLGVTSNVLNSSDYSNNFANNLSNANFSSAVFTLASGNYDITGNLFSTLQDFNATNGAVKFQVIGETKVLEPSAIVLLFVGLGLLALARLRV